VISTFGASFDFVVIYCWLKRIGAFLNLEDLEIYQLSMEIGEEVWAIVNQWDDISKHTIGTQLIRSVDSIAANISEGFGRYHYKEAKQFCYYARGSLFETKAWLTKARKM